MVNTATRFALDLGGVETRSYELYKTTAPADYDGFGTLTLYAGGGIRYVLVATQHRDWQLSRYASGLFTGEASDDMTTRDIAQKLWAALIRGLNRE